MPKMKSGLFDQDKYVREYIHENRIAKSLTFNRKNEEDMRMLQWLNSKPEGFNKYMKRLILADMEGETK